MGDGSRWYFPVYEGLFAAEHCEKMGQALWLYGWLVARAHVAQQGGVVQYNHLTAANDLGKSERTVRLWFLSLQEHGYIELRARHQYHLEVQVTNWRTVEEWWNARGSTPDGQLLATLGQNGNQSGNQTGNQTGKILPPIPLYITLQHYEYPTGADGADAAARVTSLADAFNRFLDALKASKNQAAMMCELHLFVFGVPVPGEDMRAQCGFVGRAAKQVGGWGRLAQVMWSLAADAPTGDPLSYIIARYGQKRDKRAPTGISRPSTDEDEERRRTAIEENRKAREVWQRANG